MKNKKSLSRIVSTVILIMIVLMTTTSLSHGDSISLQEHYKYMAEVKRLNGEKLAPNITFHDATRTEQISEYQKLANKGYISEFENKYNSKSFLIKDKLSPYLIDDSEKISSPFLNWNEDAVRELFENFSMEEWGLEDEEYHIFISPYALKSPYGHYIDGFYTYDSNKDYHTIVICCEWQDVTEMIGTLLHEIGHSLEQKMINDGSIDVLGNYKALYPSLLNKQSRKWEDSISESFAEDFRIYNQKNLGYTFVDKRTNGGYNEDALDLLEKYKNNF